MGVRLALGANRRSIIGLILKQAAVRLLAGLTLGVAFALGLNQVLRSAIEGLTWLHWQTLLALAALMAAVSAAAALAPALRATRVDPMRLLRA